MPEEEVRITLRLPAGLRDQLQKSAEEKERSMNGEIVTRLDWSFVYDSDSFGHFVERHEEMAKDHLELVKENGELKRQIEQLNLYLAASKAALAEQKALSAKLQHILSTNFGDAKKEADEKAETMAAIEARFNEMREHSEYLESLKAQLLELSKERDQLAEARIQEQAALIERLAKSQESNAVILNGFRKVFLNAADKNEDLKNLVEIFKTIGEEDI